jgi:hypothetical protein
MRRLGRAIVVLMVLTVGAGAVNASVTPERKCYIAKQKAAAKKATAKLKCWQKATAVLGASADPNCLAKAETKFNTAIEKAEATGGCAITGQASAIEVAVDTCVSNILAVTSPPCNELGGYVVCTCADATPVGMDVCPPTMFPTTCATYNALAHDYCEGFHSGAGTCTGSVPCLSCFTDQPCQ